jgi:hypothetical protein
MPCSLVFSPWVGDGERFPDNWEEERLADAPAKCDDARDKLKEASELKRKSASGLFDAGGWNQGSRQENVPLFSWRRKITGCTEGGHAASDRCSLQSARGRVRALTS